MTDPKILAEALAAAVKAEEQRQEQERARLGEFVAGLLIPNEPRDEQGRFTNKESADAEAK